MLNFYYELHFSLCNFATNIRFATTMWVENVRDFAAVLNNSNIGSSRIAQHAGELYARKTTKVSNHTIPFTKTY